jgi:hypothetical protein
LKLKAQLENMFFDIFWDIFQYTPYQSINQSINQLHLGAQVIQISCTTAPTSLGLPWLALVAHGVWGLI